jgi:hypothetical protein
MISCRFAALTIAASPFSYYECAINPDKSILPRIYKSSAKTFDKYARPYPGLEVQVELDGYRLGISAASARKMLFITSRRLQRGRPLPSARRGGMGISGSMVRIRQVCQWSPL